ncbi:MAG: ATP phosphoribosyltransferase regulatory subunit, partial [Lachnospiraceae bacterium]|nr:ATP phosphoribosyltransferase regulatory subunit [Lachnospiraceae bacterium]
YYDNVIITLDKLDKIGMEGVAGELLENGFSQELIDKYLDLFKGFEAAENGLQYIYDSLGEYLEDSVKTGLKEIIDSVSAVKSSDFEIVFDPSLVRGMSYYTGTIFEIAMPELGIACGGGGRYDKMIGKFTGKDVPACGFSIGFERIVLLLLENGFQVPNQKKKTAFLIEKGISSEKLCEIIAQAQKLRSQGTQVLVARMNKNKKFQKETLAAQGYEEFQEFFVK